MTQPREHGKFAPKARPVEAPPVMSLSPPFGNQPLHRTITCAPEDVRTHLDRAAGYRLLSMCAYTVGAGFGATIHVLLVFRREDS